MKRTQFNFSEEEAKAQEELMKATDIVTKKDLFKNAISFLAWAVEEAKKGRIIFSMDEESGDKKELLMPALQRARRR